MSEVENARSLFNKIIDADGCGIVVIDLDLLAKYIAEQFGVSPTEVYEDFEEEEEEKECCLSCGELLFDNGECTNEDCFYFEHQQNIPEDNEEV